MACGLPGASCASERETNSADNSRGTKNGQQTRYPHGGWPGLFPPPRPPRIGGHSPRRRNAMPAPLTRTLGRFAAELTYEKLPAEAVEVVKTGFTDTVAVMFAGRDEPVARIVRDSL